MSRTQINIGKKIKALALDLDGTALLPNNTLGGYTIEVLKKVIACGIQVMLCTGRAIEAAEPFRAAIGAQGPMVFFNGAEVVDMPSAAMLDAALLDLEAADFGIDLVRSMGLHYQLYLPPGAYGSGKWEALLVEKLTPEAEMYREHTGIEPVVTDLKAAIKTPGLQGCVKAMFITEPERHDEIRKKLIDRFGQRIYVARTFPTFLEIMTTGVSKGAGLKTVMRHRGLDAASVLALGDEENDMLMFNAAGFSAAPSNAREKVKDAADFIFGSNAEEGLASFLEEIFYGG
jgi:Cof subfamily protein (haloacid dehalogenase superfamily)